VENYIRREIYHQVLTGVVPLGLLEPQALVDEVFLIATTQSTDMPSNLAFDQWMFQIARRTLRRKVQEIEAHRGELSVQDAAAAQERWEDEELNFYQPDESLQVEDLLTDGKSWNPEELLKRDEIAAQVQQEIANLPDAIRESFVLFALEGFTSDEVAMLTEKTPEKIVQEVETAREILRKQLH
jgi:RNA polymerase sigma factor (sigma-70 family)